VEEGHIEHLQSYFYHSWKFGEIGSLHPEIYDL